MVLGGCAHTRSPHCRLSSTYSTPTASSYKEPTAQIVQQVSQSYRILHLLRTNMGVVWVELEHSTQILQRILLQAMLASWSFGSIDDRLNLVGVDKPGKVSIRHWQAWYCVSLL